MSLQIQSSRTLILGKRPLSNNEAFSCKSTRRTDAADASISAITTVSTTVLHPSSNPFFENRTQMLSTRIVSPKSHHAVDLLSELLDGMRLKEDNGMAVESSAEEPRNPADTLIKSGIEHLKAKQFAQAETDLHQACLAAPTNILAHIYLSLTLHATNQLEASERVLTIMLQRLPPQRSAIMLWANVILAFVKEQQNKISEAESIFNNNLEDGLSHGLFLQHYAEFLSRKGEFVKACTYYAKAKVFLPDNISLLKGYASCLQKTGAPIMAVEMCRRALEIESPVFRYIRQAEDLFNSEDNLPEVMNNLAYALTLSTPRDLRSFRNYYLFYLKKLIENGNEQEAKKCYEKLIKSEPLDGKLLIEYVEYINISEDNDCVNILEFIFEQISKADFSTIQDMTDIKAFIRHVAFDMGTFHEEAKQVVDRLIAVQDSSDLRMIRAMILQNISEEDNQQQIHEDYKMAFTLDPSNAHAHECYAQFLEEQGNYEEAFLHFKDYFVISQSNGQNASISYLISCLEQLNKKDKLAKFWYKKACELEPDNQHFKALFDNCTTSQRA